MAEGLSQNNDPEITAIKRQSMPHSTCEILFSRVVPSVPSSLHLQDGALGEAPGGGSLATYRELCALATDMGQPDLLYRLTTLTQKK